jgi:GNAT superfamily N-acetyltransferase
MKIELLPYDLNNRIEVDELYHTFKKYFQHSPWPPTIEKIMGGGVKYFKAFHENKHIGLSGIALKTPTLAETVKTTIFNEFQGQGLGRLLSMQIEEECRAMGIKKVMTTIYHFNHSMINIKLQQGYTIEGYHPDHEAPGFHEYSLGKILK